jgi:LysM repeat protein
MAARSSARYLAPIALAAALLAILLVVGSTDGGGGSGAGTRSTTTQRKVVPTRRTYVVRQGDTLVSIAARFGLTPEGLVALNPTVDAQALQPGVRLKLRQ